MDKRVHIVLDLDGTLLYDCNTRPHLDEFLRFCFQRFASVSIWTAASRDWWLHCWSNHMRQFDFTRVLTSKDCVCSGRGFYNSTGDAVVTKPLRKLWDDPSNDMEEYNTLVVDDTPQTAIENAANFIAISSYIYGDDDEGLIHLQKRLKEMMESYSKTHDIRNC